MPIYIPNDLRQRTHGKLREFEAIAEAAGLRNLAREIRSLADEWQPLSRPVGRPPRDAPKGEGERGKA